MPGVARHDAHVALGRLLRDRRRAAGQSQQCLAERIGRKQSYISKLERGERRVDAVELLEVADAIGCDISQLFDDLRALRKRTRQKGARAPRKKRSMALPATPRDTPPKKASET